MMKKKTTTTITVFVVEDNIAMRDGLEQVVRRQGHEVCGFESAEAGLDKLRPGTPHIVITDYKLPGMDGLAFLEKIKERNPDCEIIVITAYGSIELAVEAMQKGAADFITKPFSPEELAVKLQKVMERLEQRHRFEKLQAQNLYWREQDDLLFNFGEIIGKSPAIEDVFRVLRKVAPTDSTVIIYGESGTGKELAARAIHKNSRRSEGPFIRVHCGALVESLLESELFGHEKGAFTGAIKRKHGRFELADGGTIFLDEIGEVSPAVQIKLLRVLQEKEFERVGGEDTVHVNARIIAATNCNLKEKVEAGSFREDLYYRLHILPITMPPLRNRMSDLPLLIQHFVDKMAREIGKPGLRMSPEALQRMKEYHWPGNVRELENVIERAAVLCDNELITSADLPPLVRDRSAVFALPDDDLDLNRTLAEVERAMIDRAMSKAHGVKAEAARILGIKTTTLLYKLSKYDSPEAGNQERT